MCVFLEFYPLKQKVLILFYIEFSIYVYLYICICQSKIYSFVYFQGKMFKHIQIHISLFKSLILKYSSSSVYTLPTVILTKVTTIHRVFFFLNRYSYYYLLMLN